MPVPDIKMKKSVKEAWIAELRSGKYKQGTGYLTMDDNYCCLGVLCEMAYKENVITKSTVSAPKYTKGEVIVHYADMESILPPAVAVWAGMYNPETEKYDEDRLNVVKLLIGNNHTSLAFLNDHGSSFNDIADIIENHIIAEDD